MLNYIILIPLDKRKADYINLNDSVFMDNYFPDKMSVKEICDISVFDVDAAECLLDSNQI